MNANVHICSVPHMRQYLTCNAQVLSLSDFGCIFIHTAVAVMTGAQEAPAIHPATAVTEDQTAESAAQAAEPADASAAEVEASDEPKQEPEHVKEHAKFAASKTKATPAKLVASEAQQSAEQPSGRRERKQTNFFQPEKKIETEKLEIREVSI